VQYILKYIIIIQTLQILAGTAGVNTLIPATPSTATVCSNFTFTAGEDQLNIPLLAKVPYNISTGVKSVQLRAVATAV
jgi:hypothetical protein